MLRKIDESEDAKKKMAVMKIKKNQNDNRKKGENYRERKGRELQNE